MVSFQLARGVSIRLRAAAEACKTRNPADPGGAELVVATARRAAVPRRAQDLHREEKSLSVPEMAFRLF
jgi:hypothetical protein